MARSALPSPFGKVPQCVHWGGRGLTSGNNNKHAVIYGKTPKSSFFTNCTANTYPVPNLFSHPNRFRRADWGASFPKGEAMSAARQTTIYRRKAFAGAAGGMVDCRENRGRFEGLSAWKAQVSASCIQISEMAQRAVETQRVVVKLSQKAWRNGEKNNSKMNFRNGKIAENLTKTRSKPGRKGAM